MAYNVNVPVCFSEFLIPKVSSNFLNFESSQRATIKASLLDPAENTTSRAFNTPRKENFINFFEFLILTTF